MFVKNTKASSLLQARQCALEDLNIEGLFKLSLKIDIIILHITSDMASSHLRMRLEVRKMVGEQNQLCLLQRNGKGIVLLLEGFCISHILSRVIKRCYDQHKLIDKMHHVAFACNHTRFYHCLCKAVALSSQSLITSTPTFCR